MGEGADEAMDEERYGWKWVCVCVCGADGDLSSVQNLWFCWDVLGELDTEMIF